MRKRKFSRELGSVLNMTREEGIYSQGTGLGVVRECKITKRRNQRLGGFFQTDKTRFLLKAGQRSNITRMVMEDERCDQTSDQISSVGDSLQLSEILAKTGMSQPGRGRDLVEKNQKRLKLKFNQGERPCIYTDPYVISFL